MLFRQHVATALSLCILWILLTPAGLVLGETADEGSLLEEIVVTATRRDASVQSIAVSVKALTADEIARINALDFADYARNVPGLEFRDLGIGGEAQIIRGVSSATAFEVNATTATYLDEVPITTAGGTGGPYSPKPLLYDIDRIEVLRGPQGTLFGASSLGGAIRILTRQPDTTRREGFVAGSVSKFGDGDNSFDLSAMINAPIADGRAAIRAVAYYRNLGGYIDNISTGQSDINNQSTSGARISFRTDISDRARVIARIAYQDRDSDGNSIEDMGLPPRVQSRRGEANGDGWLNANVQFDIDLPFAQLMSSTSFFERDVDTRFDISPFLLAAFGVDNQLNVQNTDDTEEFVQEFRLVSPTDRRSSWIAGLFIQDQQLQFNQSFPSPGLDALTGGAGAAFGTPDSLGEGMSKFTLEQVAVYGELAHALTDTLDLTLGARWFNIERDYSSELAGLLYGGINSATVSASESGAMPKVSLGFSPSDTAYWYVIAAQGFRPGGVNPPEISSTPACMMDLATRGLATFPTSYDADSLWSYELGSKHRFAGDRIHLDAAVYHLDWRDIQLNQFLPCGATFIQNLAEATVSGAEIGLRSMPSDRLFITAGVNYSNAVLAKDEPSIGGVKGDRLPSVPRFSANLGGRYYFTLPSGYETYLNVDILYVGDSLNGVEPLTRAELPSHYLANVELGLQSENWIVALFIKNAFDERGLVGVESTALGLWETATPPRRIGLRASRSFH